VLLEELESYFLVDEGRRLAKIEGWRNLTAGFRSVAAVQNIILS
jgi:hypothetical protein